MKRRHFIKTTLFALVAAYAPISLKPPGLEDERVIALTLDLQELIENSGVSWKQMGWGPSLTLGQLSDIAYRHGRQIEVELVRKDAAPL